MRNHGIHRTKTSLIFAKSRIAPIKGATIPRLELLAVLIGVRAAHFVIKQLELKTKTSVMLWSDSKCVLHWIQNFSKLLSRFVRIGSRYGKQNFSSDIFQVSIILWTLQQRGYLQENLEIMNGGGKDHHG